MSSVTKALVKYDIPLLQSNVNNEKFKHFFAQFCYIICVQNIIGYFFIEERGVKLVFRD